MGELQEKAVAYLARKEKMRQSQRAQRKGKRKTAPNVLYEQLRPYKQRPCSDCGGTFPEYCMDFHHITERKNGDISKMIAQKKPWAEIEAELRQCILICANCHRIRHHA